jgi:hypothetical protein
MPTGRNLGDREVETTAAIKIVAEVMDERIRQMLVEGWTPEHDDEHAEGEMALAASCYARSAANPGHYLARVPRRWPWDRLWWKPSGPRRELVKAAALIVAEIERLDRARLHPHAPRTPMPKTNQIPYLSPSRPTPGATYHWKPSPGCAALGWQNLKLGEEWGARCVAAIARNEAKSPAGSPRAASRPPGSASRRACCAGATSSPPTRRPRLSRPEAQEPRRI